MIITLLGTGFAVPTPSRVQTGILIDTDENLILVDCGSGILHRLSQSGYDPLDITHVVFTHHHLDHDGDFMSLLKSMWLMGKRRLNVVGPEGTNSWLNSLMEAYPYMKERIELDVQELYDGGSVKIGKTKLEARRNKHGLKGLAYKVSFGRTSVVISGDTAPSEGVKTLCKGGVDLLIHECSFPDVEGETFKDHTTPRGLGELLKDLPVKKLVLTHFSPMAEKNLENLKFEVKKYFNGEVILGKDLMTLRV